MVVCLIFAQHLAVFVFEGISEMEQCDLKEAGRKHYYCASSKLNIDSSRRLKNFAK